jgi:hypothetical protein
MRDFCKIVWTWETFAQDFAPGWTQEQCEKVLEKHEEKIRAAMILAASEEIGRIIEQHPTP